MTWQVSIADALSLPLPDQSVDMVMFSPPYLGARLYGMPDQIKPLERIEPWACWMVDVVSESLRVCRGAVIVVCAGQTKGWNYHPAPEALAYKAHAAGIHQFRPCFWHRVGIPGSGSGQWYRADVESVLCFKRPGKSPFAEPTANGHVPKWAPGGSMSHRLTTGEKVNQWGKVGGGLGRRPSGKRRGKGSPSHVVVKMIRQPDGSLEAQSYLPPKIANPGNLVRGIPVGGGQMGHLLAHENEAPYPVRLAEYFIRSHCPAGGTVLDPMCGSGTTLHAAVNLGRTGIGYELRESQVELTRRRMSEVVEGKRSDLQRSA